jgi:hypothetical protein
MTGDAGTSASYAQGLSDVTLVGRTIGEDLQRTVERFADREALVSSHQGLRYTYGQLGDGVNRVASGLLAAAVAKGNRVGTWAPNCAPWVVVQYATANVGAVLVTINPAIARTSWPSRCEPVRSQDVRGRDPGTRPRDRCGDTDRVSAALATTAQHRIQCALVTKLDEAGLGHRLHQDPRRSSGGWACVAHRALLSNTGSRWVRPRAGAISSSSSAPARGASFNLGAAAMTDLDDVARFTAGEDDAIVVAALM